MPAEGFGQHSARQQADGRARSADEAVDADGPRALPLSGNSPITMPRITAEATAPAAPCRNLATINISGSDRQTAECRRHRERPAHR